MKTTRTAVLGAALVALVALTSCSARDEDAAEQQEVPEGTAEGASTGSEPSVTSQGTSPVNTATGDASGTTAADEADGETFGTMESPCGPGDATIAEGQNGDDGVLHLAVGNDHDNPITPGLTQEMLDASEAFAGWCNEQGGIQGLQIDIIDMDGHITEAAAAMETACSEAFAMVGGGLVLDDQTFPRFHECSMIDFAGYTVTPAKAMSNGMVQPLPSPVNTRSGQQAIWAAEAFPDAVRNAALMYTDIDSVKVASDMMKATMEAHGWNIQHEFAAALTEANWTAFAQQLKDNQVGAFSFTGEPVSFAQLLKAMDEVDYRPELILQETNHYDQVLLEQAGEAAEGVYARLAYAPLEEPDQYPAIADYLDMMATYKPDGKVAQLGMQSTSAHLMFATAANDCLDSNDGVLERECVLEAGTNITSWTGGGLHAETNPSSNEPPACGIIMEVVDGQWQRAYPELGSEDDSGDGFNCRPDGATEIEGTFGDSELGVDPDRPN